MKHLMSGTRVLVADGGKALVFHNAGDNHSPNLKLERSYGEENPPTREQGSDKPGRMNDSFGNRSSVESPDWHRIAEDRFLQRLADDMAEDLRADAYEHLIVVAPPIALGTLRKAMSPAVLGAVRHELGKDLTKHTVADIESALAKALNQD